jgi:hypothetical protein
MDRLAEMSCRRYGIKRAVRGWTGWHHHITIVLLAMLMHLKWKDKAPMLMIQDVRAIPEVIVPKRRITKRDIREFFFLVLCDVTPCEIRDDFRGLPFYYDKVTLRVVV